jgi:hypothetical protein
MIHKHRGSFETKKTSLWNGCHESIWIGLLHLRTAERGSVELLLNEKLWNLDDEAQKFVPKANRNKAKQEKKLRQLQTRKLYRISLQKVEERQGAGDQNLGDTRNTLVRQFHAPETPGRKCRLLRRHCYSKISSPKKVLELPSSQEHSSLHRKKLSTSLPYSSKNRNLKKKDSTAKISHATVCFFTSRKQREREREKERKKERNRSKADELKLQATEMNTNCRSGREYIRKRERG